MGRPVVYLIGSLRNPRVPAVAAALRRAGLEVFDDWYAAGRRADDAWRDYERRRGRSYEAALAGYAAQHVFTFDRHHLDRATVGVLVMPAGKSCHIELGYLIGQGKPAYVLFDREPRRWDVMYGFTSGVCFSLAALVDRVRKEGQHGVHTQ